LLENKHIAMLWLSSPPTTYKALDKLVVIAIVGIATIFYDQEIVKWQVRI
jgi:hypothetical protein